MHEPPQAHPDWQQRPVVVTPPGHDRGATRCGAEDGGGGSGAGAGPVQVGRRRSMVGAVRIVCPSTETTWPSTRHRNRSGISAAGSGTPTKRTRPLMIATRLVPSAITNPSTSKSTHAHAVIVGGGTRAGSDSGSDSGSGVDVGAGGGAARDSSEDADVGGGREGSDEGTAGDTGAVAIAGLELASRKHSARFGSVGIV